MKTHSLSKSLLTFFYCKIQIDKENAALCRKGFIEKKNGSRPEICEDLIKTLLFFNEINSNSQVKYL